MLYCAVISGGEPLIDRIRAEAIAPSVERIRLALGYLFVPGLEPIWDALEVSSAQEIHLLIGNTAGVLTDEQRIAAGNEVTASDSAVAPKHDMAATARADRDRIVTETANGLRENLKRLPITSENDRFILSLARAIGANRLRVRIYSEGRLHAKASLFEHTSATTLSVAIVGSSNLTLPASDNPTELNVVLHDPDQVAAVADWFDGLWDAGQDFTRALFTEISARAAENSP